MPSHKYKKKKKSHKRSKKYTSSSSSDDTISKGNPSDTDSDDTKNQKRSLSPVTFSHKHKRKKKSYKRSKKYTSSSSSDDDSLWKVKLSDADSDDTKNPERLTPLVRRTYLKYLNQALILNLEEHVKNSNEPHSELDNVMVHKWSALLEQKALRTCLVSELYRTSMVSLIRQIKASTDCRTLYIEEKPISKLKVKLPLDKESQTSTFNVEQRKTLEAETQTNFPLSSSLQLPLPKASPFSIPYDPAINFSDSNSSDAGVSSSLGSKPRLPCMVASAKQEICNITSTSDILKSAYFSPRHKTTDLEYNLNTDNIVPLRPDENSQFVQLRSAVKNHPANITFCNQSGNSKENNQTNKLSANFENSIDVKKKQANSENVSSHPKCNLDARLTALGLLNVNTEDGHSQSTEKPKKSNWYAEQIAQSCNFTRILLGMSTRKREKVTKRIKDLFGEDYEPLTELTEENITVCRKRIASAVVMELTPMYQAKRIASRHLFKYLAKKITKSIMEQSYAPDTRSIRWKVKQFFTDGKAIMSESDCI